MPNNGKRLDALEETLNGNGAPGIKGRLLVVETKLDGVKEDVSEIKDSIKWSTRFAITQAIGLAIAIGLLLLK